MEDFMNWIDIDEKLPDECTPVLLGSEFGQCINIGIYMGGQFKDPHDNYRSINMVSHWCPLPSPPARPEGSVENIFEYCAGQRFTEMEYKKIIEILKTRTDFV